MVVGWSVQENSALFALLYIYNNKKEEYCELNINKLDPKCNEGKDYLYFKFFLMKGKF